LHCEVHHSITSSARASSVAGTSMPSALAVFRLNDEPQLGRLHDRQVGELGRRWDAAVVDASLDALS
jgi:hypothetical protein